MNRELYLYCDGSRGRTIDHITVVLKTLPKDTAWKVTVQEHKSKRSDDQNRLLWALYEDIIELGGETMGGWTTGDLHEFFLGAHFGWTTLSFAGSKRKKPIRRSSRLNKQEFTDFVESILSFMAEQGVVLTLPSEAA